MNCYEFEQHISEYIDGNLKTGIRKGFSTHRGECTLCKEKLAKIMEMVKSMPKLDELETTPDFMQKLAQKIELYENSKATFIGRIRTQGLWGMDFPAAMGVAAAMVMVVGASYMLLNQDKVPVIDFHNLSTKSSGSNAPHVSIVNNDSHIADSDTSVRKEANSYNGPIKLVGGQK
jgi:anti-sigma factor RsiW